MGFRYWTGCTGARQTVVMSADSGGQEELRADLDRWVDAGLLSAAQARQIARWELDHRLQELPEQVDPVAAPLGVGRTVVPVRPHPAADPPRRSVAVEGLAYLGGAIILAALILVLAGYWHLLSPAVRIALTAVGALILLIAGSLIPQSIGPLAVRLRGVLWLLSTAATMFLLVIVVDQLNWTGGTSLLTVAFGTAAYAGVLWLLHRSPAQQVAAAVAIALVAVALGLQADQHQGVLVGVALAVVSAVWGVLAWRSLLPGTGGSFAPPGSAGLRDGSHTGSAVQRRLGMVLGSLGASVAAIILASGPDLPWLAVVPVALLVVAAMLLGDLWVLGVGAGGTLIALPILVSHYFQSTIAIALVLLGAGAVLVGLAVLVARRRPRGAGRPGDPGRGAGPAL